ARQNRSGAGLPSGVPFRKRLRATTAVVSLCLLAACSGSVTETHHSAPPPPSTSTSTSPRPATTTATRAASPPAPPATHAPALPDQIARTELAMAGLPEPKIQLPRCGRTI